MTDSTLFPPRTPAILALADGTVFHGRSIGAAGQSSGEVVFNTAMTCYQEILTDPSYAGQIITFTNPHIGNVGVTHEDAESRSIYAAGLVIRDLPSLASNWRSEGDLASWLAAAGVVEAVGDAVTSVKVGDHVVLNPGKSCRQCEYCTSGDSPLCLKYGIMGEHYSGTICEQLVVPEWNVVPIPAHIPMTEAAAFPLASLTAWRMMVSKARVRAGEHVLIWGIGGGVALQALQIAKALGAHTWVTSGSDDKLARAKLSLIHI